MPPIQKIGMPSIQIGMPPDIQNRPPVRALWNGEEVFMCDEVVAPKKKHTRIASEERRLKQSRVCSVLCARVYQAKK